MFTGYSLLATALALPDDGKVIAVDVSREYYDVGRPFIERAGVTGKVEFRGHRALEHLDALLADEGSTWTLTTTSSCSAWCGSRGSHRVRRHAVGGHGGDMMPPDAPLSEFDRRTSAVMRDLNAMLAADERVDVCQLTIGDGVTICRRLV
ncbi:hypothetical protein BDA96_07G230700 [Sorghum bicolor]|uniref:Caffeoyl-CoA O-methyltransferase n=1 Tax=Sorghum bicolor TaxID=4558 RepID=A0A921QMC3_SORBI|nr:hypothetical protein BDA96_07G230700 [Sorghum bicolor]